MTDLPSIPAPRSEHPLTRLARTAWTAPTTALGHVAGRFVAKGAPGFVIDGPLARATFYPIRRRGFGFIAAVTLGHVVLFDDVRFRGRMARIVMAHELAHTRQHDVLGPLYLPLHAAAQLVSAALWLVRPLGRSAVHAYNPLERTWIAFSIDAVDALAALGVDRRDEIEALLDAWGVGGASPAKSFTETAA